MQTSSMVTALPGNRGTPALACDLEGRRKAERFLLHQALHDSLTALPNSILLRERVEHALAVRRQDGGYVAMLLVRVDGSTTANHTLDRALADALLVEVAHRLRKSVREAETVARTGGNEFAVVTGPMASQGEVEVLARRVHGCLRRRWTVAGTEVHPTASMGIAITDDDLGADRLLQDARSALAPVKDSEPGELSWP